MTAAKALVHAFVSSRLDYSNALLYGVSEGLLRRVQSVQNAASRLVTGARHRKSHHTDSAATAHGCPCDNESNSRSLSWSSSVYLPMHRRIWQTSISSSLTSACAESARPTRRCVLFDGHTTPSATDVPQRLEHHACGTHYLLNYDTVTVLESSNGC